MTSKITISAILESITEMSVMELVELVKALNEKFDLPKMSMAAPASTAQESPVVAEQTEFNVVLTHVGDKKIEVIKCLRKALNLGLKEAKDAVDAITEQTPFTIATGISKQEAEDLKATFTESSATIAIK